MEELQHLLTTIGYRLTCFVLGAETLDELDLNDSITVSQIKAFDRVIVTLMSKEGDVAFPWLVGMNGFLGDHAPALVLREYFLGERAGTIDGYAYRNVLTAARVGLEMGA